jgi:hypothetical protein
MTSHREVLDALLAGLTEERFYNYAPANSWTPEKHEALKWALGMLDAAGEVLERNKSLQDHALTEFNLGASALSANAIRLLNEVPRETAYILEKLKGEGQ